MRIVRSELRFVNADGPSSVAVLDAKAKARQRTKADLSAVAASDFYAKAAKADLSNLAATDFCAKAAKADQKDNINHCIFY